MSSIARQLASRRNARKSTGPRTASGKARVSRNARRHGFTLPVLADPTPAPEVDALARHIERSVAGRELDASGHALACRIAEAMIDLRRVRLVKLPLVAALHADPTQARRPLIELARLDRYERYALFRRKTAIREFGAAVRRVGKIASHGASAWATARESDFAHAVAGGAVAHPTATGLQTKQS